VKRNVNATAYTVNPHTSLQPDAIIPGPLFCGRGQLLKVFVVGKIKKLLAERQELGKGTGIAIREVGDHRPGKQNICVFGIPVHVW